MGPGTAKGMKANPQAIAQMLQQLQAGSRPAAGAPPLDLTTGQPATAPPIGSNVVAPPMGMPPMRPQDVIATGQATRNAGIYPQAR